jgi:hypothetical protein
MGNSDSILNSLIFGGDVDDKLFNPEPERFVPASDVLRSLLWGEELSDDILAIEFEK